MSKRPQNGHGGQKSGHGGQKNGHGGWDKNRGRVLEGSLGGVLFVYFMCIVDKSQEIRLKCVKNGRTHFVRSDLFRLFLNCFMCT